MSQSQPDGIAMNQRECDILTALPHHNPFGVPGTRLAFGSLGGSGKTHFK
jgi:hypothetical protein